MNTYPQKSVCVNNYYYFYIYIFRVNHKPKNHRRKRLDGLIPHWNRNKISPTSAFPYTEFANNQPQAETFCPHSANICGRRLICAFGDV